MKDSNYLEMHHEGCLRMGGGREWEIFKFETFMNFENQQQLQ